MKLDPKTLLASEPVRTIMTAVAGVVGVALYAILPEGPIKWAAVAVAGSIYGGAEAARKKTVPEVKAAQLATVAATSAGTATALQIDEGMAGKRNEIPPPTEDLVRNAALNAAKNALIDLGVATGKKATEKATDLVEDAASNLANQITGRVGKILRRK